MDQSDMQNPSVRPKDAATRHSVTRGSDAMDKQKAS